LLLSLETFLVDLSGHPDYQVERKYAKTGDRRTKVDLFEICQLVGRIARKFQSLQRPKYDLKASDDYQAYAGIRYN
jgi:hypothetical protein